MNIRSLDRVICGYRESVEKESLRLKEVCKYRESGIWTCGYRESVDKGCLWRREVCG